MCVFEGVGRQEGALEWASFCRCFFGVGVHASVVDVVCCLFTLDRSVPSTYSVCVGQTSRYTSFRKICVVHVDIETQSLSTKYCCTCQL